jgi:hypothetical protein
MKNSLPHCFRFPRQGRARAGSAPFISPADPGHVAGHGASGHPRRKKVVFHNPTATALIAGCPGGPTRAVAGSTAPIFAAINGAGCITLLHKIASRLPARLRANLGMGRHCIGR